MSAEFETPIGDHRPIVVGYDGRDESERALDLALAEARLRSAAVVAVVVAALPTEWVDPYDTGMAIGPTTPIPIDGPAEVQPYLEHVRRRLSETGIPGEVVWGFGDPVGEIIRVADERQAGLIVVGTHHHSRLGRMLGADIAASVGREAHCDVIVAR